MFIPWKGQPFPPKGNRHSSAEALVRILVIDDEPSLARSITALLQSDDRLIEECGSVAGALARLNTAAYDLIVLDFRLPDASGLAVMDWLLSHDRRESVIMISAEQSLDAAVGALRRGAADFLLKPYSAEQLRRSVGTVLAKRQQERNKRQIRQRLESSEQMHRYLVESSPGQSHRYVINPSTSARNSSEAEASRRLFFIPALTVELSRRRFITICRTMARLFAANPVRTRDWSSLSWTSRHQWSRFSTSQ